MNRRLFLAASFAAAFLGCAPSAGEAAPPFKPTRFSVEVKGAGPDVILIPGLTAGRDVWSGTVASLPGYRYHLVQVAGFAGEPARGNAAGAVVAPVADEIARYIQANGLQRPAIVGHSMGGTVAMMVGARRPDAVGKIMVVDMMPQPAGLIGSSASAIGPLARTLNRIVGTPGGRRLFESVIGNFGNTRDGGSPSDTDVVARAMHELANTDLTPELPRLKAPLTVVYAALDAEDAPRATRIYTNAYRARPGARLVRIDDSGHMIMYDQPGRFRATLKEFLAN
jgi:pimeloyl-ACP methyl ester carboxylesterase